MKNVFKTLFKRHIQSRLFMNFNYSPFEQKNHFRAFDVKASMKPKAVKMCYKRSLAKKSSFLVILHEILLTLKCFMLEHERDFCKKKTLKTFSV